MADGDRHPTLHDRRVNDSALALAREWKRLGRAATFVAVLTSPVLFVLLYRGLEWGILGSLLGTIAGVAIFRGLIDVIAHRLIPAPTLYGAEDELKDEDVVSRRRLYYWRKKFRNVWRLFVVLAVLVVIAMIYNGFTGGDSSVSGGISTIGDLFSAFGPIFFGYLPIIFILFFANFLILFGPLLLLGAGQIKGYEPGDADWGVKLEDVRGQAEAKEEITRVVSLWQSGEAFEKAGGKRERGVLFLGAPGTGKTMLSKGIATSFNCPFVSIPGSGFAQTFIGMDAVLVRYLAMKAKRLARKWGGQCIVFIDEIDAVGMRRQALGSGYQPLDTSTIHDSMFFGANGALTWDGDLVLETAAWRERLFQMRAEPRGPVYPPAIEKLAGAIRNMMIPGMMGGGGGLALNQLLVVMDGIDDPPLMKRIRTKRINTFLDALYFVPRKVGKLSLRLPPPKPNKEEIYFIGACNVSLSALDPALTRPGRMGRHIYFRTPTWEDRRDIFDLYLEKVAHDPELDTPERRDELARITNGYSPAMIDQVCSMALTYAHSDGPRVLRARGPRRGDDDGRGGRRDRPAIPEARGARDRDPRGRARRLRPPVHGEPDVDAALDPQARLLGRPPPGDGDRGPLRRLALRAGRRPDLGPRRDGGRVRLLRPEHDRRRRRRRHGDRATPRTWSASTRWGRRRSTSTDRIADRERREEEEERVMERFEKIGLQIMQRSGGGMMDGEPVRRRCSATARSASWWRGCSARRSSSPTTRSGRTATAPTTSPAGSCRRASSTATTSCRLLEDARLERPEIDLLDEDTWPEI